jgi:hypothetical protein
MAMEWINGGACVRACLCLGLGGCVWIFAIAVCFIELPENGPDMSSHIGDTIKAAWCFLRLFKFNEISLLSWSLAATIARGMTVSFLWAMFSLLWLFNTKLLFNLQLFKVPLYLVFATLLNFFCYVSLLLCNYHVVHIMLCLVIVV